jgi:hypothetical protein
MRLLKKSIVVLAGVMGLVTGVLAGNSGLSPIVVPNMPPQDVQVMLAQANQAEQSSTKPVRTVGICQPVQNVWIPLGNLGEVFISPVSEAAMYFLLYEHREIIDTGTSTVTQNPKHGILKEGTDGLFSYQAEVGYLGKDSATVLVNIDGLKVKVVYSFLATDKPTMGNRSIEILCGKRGYRWKISSTLDANGNSTITSVEYQSPVITATATIARVKGVSITINIE